MLLETESGFDPLTFLLLFLFSPGYTIFIKYINIPAIYFKIFCASYLLNHTFADFWENSLHFNFKNAQYLVSNVQIQSSYCTPLSWRMLKAWMHKYQEQTCLCDNNATFQHFMWWKKTRIHKYWGKMLWCLMERQNAYDVQCLG